ncbi:nickel ABC transporter ATP-binding protein NikE [Phyllobacterium sophorae]|uniref:Glutathione ABC transporter ATP-binding protein n=1 Tax=Phyllobacterium sophorae TaxID=1520277 RepID=A0A2P7AQI4_9HYPH|nr:ABC transporter ATP-binding protein [Phyllobacterium sophorae]PSH56482.1 glutathione ABC transporter ATP-binding protein [Phyllobacterium sophorae]
MIEANQSSGVVPLQPLLSIKGLGVGFSTGTATSTLSSISFDLMPGEILGIVGESGSGKSVTCRAITGLLPNFARVRGEMIFDGQSRSLSSPRMLAPLRGADMAMIFQDPMSALDPLMTVRRHLRLRTKEDPAIYLRQAGIDEPNTLLDTYAHQLSGGQCQRVAIACALSRNPRLLIADEPTTALDVTVQAGILRRLKALSAERNMAIIFVTHDLAVVYQLCDRVLVMHQGQVVESGDVKTVLTAPKAPYTQDLIRAIPRPAVRGERLVTVPGELGQYSFPAPPAIAGGHQLLEFQAVKVQYKRPDGSNVDAVKDVSLTLKRGEILGLVGESGSGKSTLAKTAVGLARPISGNVMLDGERLDWNAPRMQWRRDIQYIFQDPRGALDPSARILSQVRMPLDVHRLGEASERDARARALMRATRLEDALFSRKPASLSGGQRQRATIARALTLQPKVLICDESVSALDVSIQARVLDLLMDLREKLGIAILFISHDLSVIDHLCDRVAVMRQGELVEEGETEALFRQPVADYTQDLIAAIPRLPSFAGVQIARIEAMA